VKTADLDQRARARRPTPHEQYRTSPPVTLPSELSSFGNYRGSFWRNADGITEPAPWLQEQFPSRLEHEAERSLASGHWTHSLLFARAAEQLQVESVPRPRDLLALVHLISNPTLEGRGLDETRTQLLQQYAENPHPTFRLRLLLLLEALSPGDVAPPVARLRLLCETADFDCPPLTSIFEDAFQVNAEGGRALRALHAAQQATESP
jgi:hypothetical protein